MNREERKMAQVMASFERIEQRKPVSTKVVSSHDPVGVTPRTKRDAMSDKSTNGRSSKSKKSKKDLKIKTGNSKSSQKAKKDTGVDNDGKRMSLVTTPKKRWMLMWAKQLAKRQENRTEKEEPIHQESEHIKPENTAQHKEKAFVQEPVHTDTVLKTGIISNTETVQADSEYPSLGNVPASNVSEAVANILSVDKQTQQEAKVDLHENHSDTEPGELKTEEVDQVSSSITLPEKNQKADSEPKTNASEVNDSHKNGQDGTVVETNSLKRKALVIDTTLPTTTKIDQSIILTESEQSRLERRKKKKTNWDIGDPNFGKQSRAKSLPSSSPRSGQRLTDWRLHPRSMDPHDVYHPGPRAYISPPRNNGPPRRFSHSNSMPLERSRSMTRISSARYR